MASPAARPHYFDVDFNQTPFVVAWEMTRACALACRHCRASAMPQRDPNELSTADGRRLIDELAAIGRPILVLTGGDPFMRRDLVDLAQHAVQRGLRVAVSPSATALATPGRLRQLRDTGVSMVHVSLDGLEATHDAFRGVTGSYARTLRIMQGARAVAMPLQIGTTVTRQTVADLHALAGLLVDTGIQVWNLFFLVPTGRGRGDDMLDAQETELTLDWLWTLSQQVPFRVRTTAAQHYRRVVIQGERLARGLAPDVPSAEVRWEATGAGYAFREGRAPEQKGVNDGNGFAFVSHVGEVMPSGFLQLSAGNVRDVSFTDIYRGHPLFQSLRDPYRLKGKCHRCSYRAVCGGSRARAWATTGDPLASDPACAYQPPG